MARKLKVECEECGLTINLERMKYICIGEGKEGLKLEGEEEIKLCTECTYLGIIIEVGRKYNRNKA